ncbi:MAG: PKD domain-containing protein [Chloroflexi bacterium]|nr:PKD domain-containing protein [Chloroflexota bacterium]
MLLLLVITFLAAACNLTSAPEEQITLTEVATTTAQPTRTLLPTAGLPTTLPLTRFVIPTARPGQIPPTTVILPPTWVASAPTSTPLPISIVILSPIPGNVVAGAVQVLGSAIHPQFLQYQLEYGPDPNPGNLWFPATGIVQTPVINGLLGIWNTTAVQDAVYQLRLRVYLRDGSSLYTVVNNIRIQNQVPTPVPSNTPNVQRPIAAFTQDRANGQAPLVVRFFNQSSGQISSYSWNFGDGGTSPDPNPTYTFRSPGVFNVTLTVTGPGGSSNVSRQINVQGASAPVAAFTQDRVSGPSPLTVKFTNQSTGQITTYNWNFGDGTQSAEQSPTHQFTTVGTYNVILTVSGPGGSSSVTRKITVEDPVIPPPVAAFRTDKSSGDAPLAVQFINQSTGQMQSFNWDFGDGTTSTDANPAHTYNNPGTYTARLTVVGPGGQNTAQQIITVTQKPNAPVAGFVATPTSGNAPLTVQFTNQSTGQITSYRWDFGDGTQSDTQNPSHTYATPGTYTVTLTVTGPGGTDDAQGTVTAAQPIAAPDAAFTPNPAEGNAPLTVQFTNQSSGQNLTHVWDFGDGTTSNEVNPAHTYTNPGTYTVRLNVANEGGKDNAEAQVRVAQPLPTDTPAPTLTPIPAEPVAAFTANPTSGDAPLTVQFTNQSSGDITSIVWNFGDGSPETGEPNPAHVYNTAGAYTVTLTVNGPGGSNATQQTITVNTPPPTQTPLPAAPVAAFSANPTSGDAPLTVQFTNQLSGDITGIVWNFGDGSPETGDTNPSHVYNAAGVYTVTLTVNGPGGSNATQQTITVNAPLPTQTPLPAAPVAAFSANPTSGDAPLTVQFTNQSSGDITGIVWNFGDGSPESGEANPSHTYDTPNTYTVTLTVNGPGGSNSTVQTITVNAPAPTETPLPAQPVAAFSANPTSGDAPLTVQFTNESSGDITGIVWNFGDGSPEISEPNPSHTYDTPNTYTVTLTVNGPGGSNSTVQTIAVNQPEQQPKQAITDDIVFTSLRDGNRELYLMRPDGTVNNLTNNAGDDNNAAWSPDGSQIAFSYDRDGDREIYVMNADGSNVIQLTFNDNVSDDLPAWSPDGSTIFYTTDQDGNLEIYAMSTDGSNPRNVTQNPADDHSPAIAEDGSGRMLFVSNREDANDEIYVMAADGSVTRLTFETNSREFAPTWSPDGNQIAFTTDRDGNLEVYVMNADGSNPTNLTQNNADDANEDWSPDGSQIVFTTNRDGNDEIYVMNADGSNPVNLTNNPAHDNRPDFRPR